MKYSILSLLFVILLFGCEKNNPVSPDISTLPQIDSIYTILSTKYFSGDTSFINRIIKWSKKDTITIFNVSNDSSFGIIFTTSNDWQITLKLFDLNPGEWLLDISGEQTCIVKVFPFSHYGKRIIFNDSKQYSISLN